MCSKKVLAFVNTPLSPFEQVEMDYADRYKAGDTCNLPPIISNSPQNQAWLPWMRTRSSMDMGIFFHVQQDAKP